MQCQLSTFIPTGTFSKEKYRSYLENTEKNVSSIAQGWKKRHSGYFGTLPSIHWSPEVWFLTSRKRRPTYYPHNYLWEFLTIYFPNDLRVCCLCISLPLCQSLEPISATLPTITNIKHRCWKFFLFFFLQNLKTFFLRKKPHGTLEAPLPQTLGNTV